MTRWSYRWRTMGDIERADLIAALLTIGVVLASLIWLGRA